MAIENLIKMAEQVSRLGDQDLAMLTKEEGIQSVLAATEMKDRERIRSEVPVMNMNQPTVIDNLINRTLGMNRQVDPTAMPMPNPEMMGNMPVEPPNMPPMQQTMPNDVDPRMLAQQPPMARMGGLLRRFANGGDLDTDYIKALGEDPNKISMARYNEITSPQFQAEKLGYNYNFMGGIDFKGMLGGPSNKLQQAKLKKNAYLDNVLNQNLPVNVFQAGLDQIDKEISDLELDISERSEDIEAESELRKLIDQGLIQRNPQYLSFADQAQGDTSRLLQLIEQAETDKKIDKDSDIDDDSRANLSGGQGQATGGQGTGGQGTGGQATSDQGTGTGTGVQGAVNQDNTQTRGGTPTVTDKVFGDQFGDSELLTEDAMRDRIIGGLAENLGSTLTGYTNDVTRKSTLTKSIEEKDKVDMELLGKYQKDMDAAEKALNDISETDFPSRKEIVDRNKQQVKLGIASAFFNAAATGKPSFMESMGQAFGDASAVMAKGTAKEQKDLMQLAIADYNRASKKFDIAQARRDKLSSEINTRLTNRATLEQSNRDFRFELEKEENRKLEKIAEFMRDGMNEETANRRHIEEMQLKTAEQFVKFKEELRSDEFAKINMPVSEIEGVAAIQMGLTGVKYHPKSQQVINDGINRFQREIQINAERIRNQNPDLSIQEVADRAEQEYVTKLRENEEHGSLDIYNAYSPIIKEYVQLQESQPQNREANLRYMRETYKWMDPKVYGE